MVETKPTFGEKRAEIYTHESKDPVYGMNWSVRFPSLRLIFLKADGPAFGSCACKLFLGVTQLRLFVQNRADKKFRLAVGSFKEEYSNQVEIITCRF